MYLHIAADLFIGMLDIAFLAALLLLINFYTTSNTSVRFAYAQFLNGINPALLIGTFFLCFSLKNWFGYRVSRAQNFFFYDISSRLSQRNMIRFLKDDYLRFINIDSSVLIRKISQQPIEFSNYILTNIQQVISQGVLISFTIAGILFYHPGLLLSLFVLLLPPVVLLGLFIKKKLRQVRLNSKQTSQLTLQYLNESLSGYIESNIYEKNDFFTGRYYRQQKQLNDYIAMQQTLQGLPPRLIEVFAVLGFLVLVVVNRLSANPNGVGLLDVGIFMAASYKIIPGIVKILNSTGLIKTFEFTLNDLADYKTVTDTPVSTNAVIKSIAFGEVDFYYKDQQILSQFSFEIAPGDFIGLSGRSGQGKTTMINLLLGFLSQNSGFIFINHRETTCSDRQSFWGKISYVKQQPFFINDSILKNITLSDGSHDKEKLQEVLSICGIDRLLDHYPEGLDKQITENGKNISGGQRQRISLARALYHHYDLLILDEAFGELDEAAENVILERLQVLAEQGKMIIMITHKKSSLSFCNKVLSFDEAYV